MIPVESFLQAERANRAPDPSSSVTSARTGVISSAELLAHGKLIHIQHRGELYSLRETRLGKLILTK